MARDQKLWMQIQTAYIVKRWSAARCAKEFGVDPTTIRKRASREGWTKERHRNATDASAAAMADLKGVVELEAAERQAMRDHVWAWFGNIILQSHADLPKIKNPRSRISARRDIAEMVDRFVKTGLQADEGRPLERDDTLVIEQRRLEPEKIAVNQSGRVIPLQRPPGDKHDDDIN
jgi:hypothetical protein